MERRFIEVQGRRSERKSPEEEENVALIFSVQVALGVVSMFLYNPSEDLETRLCNLQRFLAPVNLPQQDLMLLMGSELARVWTLLEPRRFTVRR